MKYFSHLTDYFLSKRGSIFWNQRKITNLIRLKRKISAANNLNMKSKTKRLIFIALFIILPVQYGLVGIIGVMESEPWPAFVFPGFKSVYVFESGFEIDQTYFEVYPENRDEPVQLLPYELFRELPRSQISGFMRAHFRDVEMIESLSQEAKNWIQTEAYRALDLRPERVDIVDAKSFFAGKMKEMQPDSTVEQFRVTLYFNGHE
jgi:hypothetical protein